MTEVPQIVVVSTHGRRANLSFSVADFNTALHHVVHPLRLPHDYNGLQTDAAAGEAIHHIYYASSNMLQRALAPQVTAAVAGAALVFSQPRTLHAEEAHADGQLINRKPIYDDQPLDATLPTPTRTAAPETPTSPAPYRATPTDRLAVQIGYARLALYKASTRAEDGVNNALTETMRLEHSFTSTIRSLAPSKETGERVFPGALYVLVASMAGSILTRNRNILLRATVPAAIGLGAAYTVLPVTMRNVGDLAWTYEERFPVLADTHLRTKERLSQFWETGKAHSQAGVGMLQDKVGETRDRMEGWVRKGN
jgi:organizing structure protein 2